MLSKVICYQIWSVIAGSNSAIDVINGKDLASAQPTFVPDRNGQSTGAIAVRDMSTYWLAPAGVYFLGDFTFTVWAKMNSCQYHSRVFDFGNGPDSDNVLADL